VRQGGAARQGSGVTAPYSSSWTRALDRLYWLPAGGIGNGLDAEAWAVIADADIAGVRPLLVALRRAGIPAYAARLTWRGPRVPWRCRIWVDTWAWSRAQDVVSRTLGGR
jgi:hypothetical protein